MEYSVLHEISTTQHANVRRQGNLVCEQKFADNLIQERNSSILSRFLATHLEIYLGSKTKGG